VRNNILGVAGNAPTVAAVAAICGRANTQVCPYALSFSKNLTLALKFAIFAIMENKSLLDKIVDILPDNLDEFDDSHAKSFNEIIAMDNHEVPIEKVNFTHLHPNIM